MENDTEPGTDMGQRLVMAEFANADPVIRNASQWQSMVLNDPQTAMQYAPWRSSSQRPEPGKQIELAIM